MAFIRRKNDPRGLPRAIEDREFFYVSGSSFYHAGLAAKAEALCSRLNSRRTRSGLAEPAWYSFDRSGRLLLDPRNADDNVRAQMDLVCGGERKAARELAMRLHNLLAGDD